MHHKRESKMKLTFYTFNKKSTIKMYINVALISETMDK